MNTTIDAPASVHAPITYASFGARFVAMIIDYIIIGILQGIVITPLLAVLGVGIATQGENLSNLTEEEQIGLIGSFVATFMSAMIVIYCIALFYFALMESSKAQASVGKMALGIKVTDTEGQRISFGKAFLRSIGKIVSGMIMYIGYIMAAFTDKKQGLHDMIANTLVVKK
jgi:uncharacterized RDD family membrane protein YckC